MQFLSLVALAGALLPGAFAVCTSSNNYVVIPKYVEPNACVPGGYYQAQDLGNTNPTDLKTRCESQCTTSGSGCAAFVGQLWKAADSNLYSGQCFYYASGNLPPSPAQCADHPTIILAEQKDTIAVCFSSSTASATAFCSSYLSIGTVTSYTSTFTPTATLTKTTTLSLSTTTTTVGSTTTTATVQTTLSQTITTLSVGTATTVVTTTAGTSTIYQRDLQIDRRAPVPTPACVASYEPSASISSACSCLSITSTTVYQVSTAPTSTLTVQPTVTTVSTSIVTSSVTSTATQTATITSLTTFTSVTVTTATSLTTVVPILVKPKICNAKGLPGANAFNYDANFNTNQASCLASCKTDNRCYSTGFYLVTDPTTGTTTGTCRKYDKSVTDSADLGFGYYNFNDKAC